MILTIAIPTYNRPDKVRNVLLKLIPQLTDNVFIRVLDNCSNIDVKSHIIDDIPSNVLDRVEIVRNRVNVGADLNFQRCFELCTTPYIWLLGDDDRVEPNAVELILGELERFKSVDLIGINFNSNCCHVKREAPVTISNTLELAEKLDFFGNWLFISTSVYKTEEYLKHIRYQAWGSYSMASQLVPPMVAISNNKTLVLSEKYIVSNIPVENINEKWSDFQICLSITTLIEANVGFKDDCYKRFGQKLKHQFVRFGDIVYSIIKSVDNNIDLIDHYHIYLFKQFYYRTIEFRDRKFKEKALFRIWLTFLENKFILKTFFNYMPRVKRRAHEAVAFHLFKR